MGRLSNKTRGVETPRWGVSMGFTMTLFKGKYRLQSSRLPGWDYSREAYYFITVCTLNMECLLGEVLDGRMHLSKLGEIVDEEWRRTERVRRNVVLDEWTVMPNHLHAILAITCPGGSPRPGMLINCPSSETPHRGVSTEGPLANHPFSEMPQRGVSTESWKPNSLGSIIGQFKGVCKKRSAALGCSFNWQPRFFDHIIRNEKSLEEIRAYIRNNPLKWDLERDKPLNLWI